MFCTYLENTILEFNKMFFLVAVPTVSIRALENQTVGQSLTLQCELVITDDGSTRSVDIIWSTDGTELQRMNDVSSTTIDNSLVYTDSYSISQLSTDDDGRVIQCEANINTTSMRYNHSFTLDVTGEYYIYTHSYYHLIMLVHTFLYSYYSYTVPFLSLLYHNPVHYKEL